MNRYIKNLKSFLSTQSPQFGYNDAHSLLEMLYQYYTDANPINNAVIACQFRQLDDILDRLTLDENNKVFALTCRLCSSHEQKAFIEGIHVGMRLFTELDYCNDGGASQ